MADRVLDSTRNKAALIAGLGLLAMTVPAILANMIVFRQTMVPGDAAATGQCHYSVIQIATQEVQ